MGTKGWKFDRPWKHGRSAWMSGKCKCEVCHQAVVKYSRDYDRKRGVKPSTQKPWGVMELVMLATDMTNREIAEATGRTVDGVEKRRWSLGLGRVQRARQRQAAENLQD